VWIINPIKKANIEIVHKKLFQIAIKHEYRERKAKSMNKNAIIHLKIKCEVPL
jgi:hypothetical protein